MTQAKLRGVLAPLATPFGSDAELDRAAFEHNLRAYVERGLHGVVVSGSTGEAALMDERERDALVEWARPVVPSTCALLVGVGAESTRTTLRLARRAAERGADAVLVVAPHYFGAAAMTETALRSHYTRIADDSPAPVVLYNIPKYMHFALSSALVGELARHENVIGIKDSTGDPASLAGYLQAQTDRFTVLTGNGTFLETAMQRGARGGIVAVADFAIELSLGVVEALARHDPSTAVELQGRLTPLARTIVGELGPAGIKAAMDCVGLRGGPPRSPLQSLQRGQLDRVRQALRDAELAVAA